MRSSLGRKARGPLGRAAGALGLALLLSFAFLPPAAESEIIVRLEVTAERVPVHLEPSDRSPVVETLPRGTVVKLSSAMKFRTNWFYVLFVSSRSGRTLAGYVLDDSVRKLNSTIKVVDLTPAGRDRRPQGVRPDGGAPPGHRMGRLGVRHRADRRPPPQPGAFRRHGVPALPPRRPRQEVPRHLRPDRPQARLGPGQPPRDDTRTRTVTSPTITRSGSS